MNGREVFLDYVKFVAISLVLVYHSSVICSPAADALLSCCVPLFFFTNGFLMLKKERELSSILKKAFKLYALFWLWGVMSATLQQILLKETVTIASTVWHVYNLDMGYVTHLWFLQTLIILYLLFPLLQSYLAENSKHRLFYLLILTGMCSVQFLCVVMRKINPMAGWHCYSLFYFLLGYAVLGVWRKKLNTVNKYCFIAIFVSAWALQSLLNIYLLSLNPSLRSALFADELVFGGYRSLFVVLMVFSFVFLLSKMDLHYNRFVVFVGKNTLGIYLLHDIVMKIQRLYYPEASDSGVLYPLLILLVCCFICVVFNSTRLGRYLIHV